MNSSNKTTTVIISITLILLLGLIGYGEYKLREIALKMNQSDSDISTLNQKVQNLENTISNTQSTVSNALGQQQQTSNNLKDQFSEISNTVGVLEKLSTTDPELLKKYSKVYFLNEHYIPASLTDIDLEYVSKNSTHFEFLTAALPFLENLFKAASDSGMSLLAQSSYRSFATQSALKASYKITYGAGTANSFSADQGYSEHQLGTTLDFTTSKTNGVLDGFDKTPEYKWLLDNAYKYGFVISYPANNTYYKFEPWHWRFVGIDLATKLHDENVYFYGMDQRVIDTYLANLFDPS